MTNDLIEMINETSMSLKDKSIMSGIFLEQLNRNDEKTLAEFLRQEKDIKPHYLKNQKWKILVGEPIKYSKPKKYIKKQLDGIAIVERKINAVTKENFLAFHSNLDEFVKLHEIPKLFYSLTESETNLYGLIVASTNTIAVEQSLKPINIVKNQSARNEIYRKIFDTKEQFKAFYDAESKLKIAILGITYMMFEPIEDKLKSEAPSFKTWAFKQLYKNMKNKIPPKFIAESFLKDDIAYNRLRANQIYNNIN